MKYNKLGDSGLSISRVGLGLMSFGSPNWQSWVLPKEKAKDFILYALDAGINLFDTADFYSNGASEEALGETLAQIKRRDKMVIATKVGLPMSSAVNHGGLSKKHILQSLDQSLRRLQTDSIDIYQLHRFDPLSPIDEVLDALDIAVRAGKVLYVGASNFSTAQIAPAVFSHNWRRVPRLTSMQLQYNLMYREEERDMIPLCLAQGIGVIAYSPLARGLLTGPSGEMSGASKRALVRTQTDLKAKTLYGSKNDLVVLDVVQDIASARGVSPSLIALAWVQMQPGVDSVLCGALELHHIDDAIAALKISLSNDELDRLERAYLPSFVKDDAFSAVAAMAAN